MRRALQITVSLVSLCVIGAGARYAYGREALRHRDLGRLYREIDQSSFGGTLPEASVEWANIGNDYGVEQTFADGTIEIFVSSISVTSGEQLRHIVEHEMCHAYVDQQGGEPVEHGAQFQNCMARFL
jgi:predicted SprT family Zn-dependent metalloprotease